jgi:hypothetical protein
VELLNARVLALGGQFAVAFSSKRKKNQSVFIYWMSSLGDVSGGTN